MSSSTDRFIEDAPALRTPDELLDALQRVSLRYPQRLKVMSISFLAPAGFQAAVNREVFFHPEFPGEKFWSEYNGLVKKTGYSALSEYLHGVSHPFTLSEAMRTLRLTGEARWPFELLRDFGARDGLFCTFRRFSVIYYAERPIRLERNDRYYLSMAANVAVERVEQFVKSLPRPSTRPELSDREKIVLRLLAEGFTANEISGQLHIGSGSVRTYVHRMLAKLRARDSAHAVNIAWRIGLFDY